MIKDINELKKKPIPFITHFIAHCTIEEKIDAYYVCVKIQSKNDIVIMKANGQTVDRNDTILNEMWAWLVADWQHLKMVNEDWFKEHIGYSIYMFYFPNEKPVLTEYKSGLTYLIDRIEYNGEIKRADDIYDLKLCHEFHIDVKRYLWKASYDIDEITKKLKKCDDLTPIFKDLISKTYGTILAKEKPEGYIFKCGKKQIYQIIENPKQNRVSKGEKSQYEFLLMSFIKFWKNNELIHLMDRSYVKTVCNLFNAFILEYEKKTGELDRNIFAESIQSPCIGHRFDICYKNIPDEITISLCKENELYKNIFKVLLVNLKRKKEPKHCVLMSKKNTDEWNDIVQTIINAG